MNLQDAFKSIIGTDDAPVVITGLDHTIVYMNPAAQNRYAKHGGSTLIGQSLLACHNENSVRIIHETIAWFLQDVQNNKKYMYHRLGCDVYMVAIRDGAGKLTGYYEKHESRKKEVQ